ncbi:ead/Ea22-like family protein [Escherichia coli]|uniref:hypothetical protein n=1 Tax=Escherichia coli TaxID=562 RepID=UPI0006A1E289|nr:hypothetical protein [Escherichia coli]EET5475800.1 ead/Ea22-like family protein [Escherichia coli]EHK1633949.1 ead/Ea22-like family protein [Escherichia coli]EHP6049201.1 ead/Ea22-like family protein [Escherichia coli]EHU7760309.1 ead/Ea22-like family protein [Escherichia coli]MBA8484119.1 ead/Ea22-like family protein [Escherichia coli]
MTTEINYQALHEEFQYMQDHYSDPADRKKQELYISAKAMLDEMQGKDKRLAALEDENEYIRKRFKELDLFFGKNILVMQAAIIEWRETGNAENALMWIYNTLFGPGELPSEDEKNAQAYFDREYEPIDKELTELHRWFYESHKREKAERTAKAENDQL